MGEQIDVENKFPAGEDGEEDEVVAHDKKGDDPETRQQALKMFVDLPRGAQIKRIISPGGLCDLSYLLVLSDSRFFLYYATEDANTAADVTLVMDVDTRHDPELRGYGAVVSGCFSEAGNWFLTITLYGWLMLWDTKEKKVKAKVLIDMQRKFEPATHMRALTKHEKIIVHFPASNRLLAVEFPKFADILAGVEEKEPEPVVEEPPKEEPKKAGKGARGGRQAAAENRRNTLKEKPVFLTRE